MQTYYKELIKSKTDIIIPKLHNGRTLESLYNPEQDAERKFQTIGSSINENIILVIGLGSGLFVKKIVENNPKAKILCTEFSEDDIKLLKEIPCVFELSGKIEIFPKEKLYETLLKEYVPALYGNLKILELPNYLSNCPEDNENIFQTEISRAINDISRDYSVQAHFGKLWHFNIINNFKRSSNQFFSLSKEKLEKKCIILGAGPGLEDAFSILKNQQNEYFVLATDTAFKAADSSKIKCDAVITLDAQNVSVSHFIVPINKETLFLVDYSSSPSIANKLLRKQNKPVFFSSGHPLSRFLSSKESEENIINAGSGTVTIAALDFAIKAGFSDIEIYGADFSFPKNKPYAKGTYLDALYNKNSSKIFSSEKCYTRLMFRTELIERNGIKTTETLESYRTSLETYLNEYVKKGIISWYKKQNVYVLRKSYENINKGFLNTEKSGKQLNSREMETACLPYIAFLRRKNPDLQYEELLQMATKKMEGLGSL